MKKNAFRLTLIAAFILLSGWFLFPTFQDYSFNKKLKEFNSPTDSLKYLQENRKSIEKAQEKRLKLGLDLQGGMHIVLEVDVLALLEGRAKNRDQQFDQIIAVVREQAKTNSEGIPSLLSAEFQKRGVRLSRYYFDLRDSDSEIMSRLNKEAEEAVNRAKEIIRNRIDQYGVAEPSITTKGGRRIVVELPGVSDKERVRKLLKGTAKLEFKLVRDAEVSFKVFQDVNKYLARDARLKLTDSTVTTDSVKYAAFQKQTDSLATVPDSLKSKEQLQKDNPLFAVLGIDQRGMAYTTEFQKGAVQSLFARADVRERIPSDLDFVFDARSFASTDDGVKLYRLYSLKREPEVTGGVITEAKATFSSDQNQPEVTMKMNDEGTKIWARVTGSNIGKQIAIVLDNAVFSAPVVQSKIPNGSSVINGLSGIEEAQDLEIVLKAGALPAPVMIVEERTVGASLGADSIRAGLLSVLFGFTIVALFMVVYYRSAGFIADFALVFNILFVIACLAGFTATLTLPGIAGLVLTIGMAVDANVLIFERVREEAKRGKSIRVAIDLGYDKAFPAILDSHLTTFGAALLLYYFGIGPIKGFAVTLMIGISASLFTAIVITKVVFDWMHDQEKISDASFG